MRRWVVKVGSSSLSAQDGTLDQARLAAIAAAALQLPAAVAVVSSGAVAAGRGRTGRGALLSLADRQALAAIGQVDLMSAWSAAFAPRPVAQFLLTLEDIQDRSRFLQARHALDAAFGLGAVPVINENDTVATAELKLGDNDTLSAWVAQLLGAQRLILLTDVDGLYRSDPRADPQAERLAEVRDLEAAWPMASGAGSAVGTGGMRTKLRAAQIAADAGIETLILGGGGPGLLRLASQELAGTRVIPKKVPARLAWLLHQVPAGELWVDSGAASAIRRGASLLPKGLRRVEGRFEVGAALRLHSPDGPLGQGLSNYSSQELQRILGLHSEEIEAALGYKTYDEVIHRNHLALFRSGRLPGG